MKRIFLCVILLLVVCFYCGLACSAEDSSRTQHQAPPTQYQPPPQQPQPQTARPILPPAVPSVSPGAFPTPSPHIAAPPVTPAPISMPSFPADAQFGTATIHNLPSVPAHVAMPATGVPAELPKVPIIGNSVGKVIQIGTEEDGMPWIEVRDEVFDETLKIKVNPQSTPVIKKASPLSYKNIKIGDAVNVIFNQDGEEITANFISILTEEDIKAMEEGLKSGSTITPDTPE